MADEQLEVSEADLHSLSDEDLGKLINKPDSPVEAGTDEKPESNEVIKESKPESEPSKKDNNQPIEAGESKEKVVESKTPKFSTPEEEVKYLRGQLETKEKQVRDKETFIQQRNALIGELRKKEDLYRSSIKDPSLIQNNFFDDPVKGVNDLLDYREGQKQVLSLQAQQTILKNEMVVDQIVPEFKEYLSDIVDILKRDGLPESAINEFKANPYLDDPGILVSLGKRAQAERMIREKENQFIDLQNQINELKKKPAQVVEKINQAAANKSISSIPASKSTDDYSETDFTKMTNEELSAFLKARKNL